jgi:hypothetical protein
MNTRIALAAAAIALTLPAAAYAAKETGLQKWRNNWDAMACTSLATEFREAVPFHGTAKKVSEARKAAAVGKEDCMDDAYVAGSKDLKMALNDIGATPEVSQADPPE